MISAPPGRSAGSSARVVSETSTWPPWAALDPRTPDDVEPEVALFPEGRFAGVQTHSNLDLGFSGPALNA
jgi:hypothetical protein